MTYTTIFFYSIPWYALRYCKEPYTNLYKVDLNLIFQDRNFVEKGSHLITNSIVWLQKKKKKKQ